MKPAIEVDRISKQFRLGGAANKSYRTLRDSLADGVRRTWGAIHRRAKSEHAATPPPEPFYALKDVSFEVQPGEVVGIIGRNGSGKSTLLKILSQIYEPTSGRALVRGRLASLLEVGTGFHPELTGRENIYLNGSILGMRRAEIKRQFDEIVAFSEIEKFLDTPVKRYSSGMYVRLAFAVAAHLNPEILIVDEVLAVGDMQFQNKCLGRMSEVAAMGRTVLFVSHQLASLKGLCTHGVLLEHGMLRAQGNINSIIDMYLAGITARGADSLKDRTDRRGTGDSRIVDLRIYNANPTSSLLTAGEQATIQVSIDRFLSGLCCTLTIYSMSGLALFCLSHQLTTDSIQSTTIGSTATCLLSNLLLLPGKYRVNAALSRNAETLDHVEAAAVFEVMEGQTESGIIRATRFGLFHQPHCWKMTDAHIETLT